MKNNFIRQLLKDNKLLLLYNDYNNDFSYYLDKKQNYIYKLNNQEKDVNFLTADIDEFKHLKIINNI